MNNVNRASDRSQPEMGSGGASGAAHDYDQCPFCHRLIAFQAFDAHVKACREDPVYKHEVAYHGYYDALQRVDASSSLADPKPSSSRAR